MLHNVNSDGFCNQTANRCPSLFFSAFRLEPSHGLRFVICSQRTHIINRIARCPFFSHFCLRFIVMDVWFKEQTQQSALMLAIKFGIKSTIYLILTFVTTHSENKYINEDDYYYKQTDWHPSMLVYFWTSSSVESTRNWKLLANGSENRKWNACERMGGSGRWETCSKKKGTETVCNNLNDTLVIALSLAATFRVTKIVYTNEISSDLVVPMRFLILFFLNREKAMPHCNRKEQQSKRTSTTTVKRVNDV